MEFTIDKIAKEVAEKALNEITYEGKTLREWVEIIVKQDCISREDAKNLFLDGTEGYDCRGFTRMEIGEMLDELPSVTPHQTRWIPCSERLPEKDEWVLITFDNDIEIALLDDDGWCYSSVGNDDWIAEHPPVAWIPLPQPYKAESEENADE